MQMKRNENAYKEKNFNLLNDIRIKIVDHIPVLYTCMNHKLSVKGAKMARGIQLYKRMRTI